MEEFIHRQDAKCAKSNGWEFDGNFNAEAPRRILTQKPIFEPPIAQINTDFEKVVEMVLKPVWWNLNP